MMFLVFPTICQILPFLKILPVLINLSVLKNLPFLKNFPDMKNLPLNKNLSVLKNLSFIKNKDWNPFQSCFTYFFKRSELKITFENMLKIPWIFVKSFWNTQTNVFNFKSVSQINQTVWKKCGHTCARWYVGYVIKMSSNCHFGLSKENRENINMNCDFTIFLGNEPPAKIINRK